MFQRDFLQLIFHASSLLVSYSVFSVKAYGEELVADTGSVAEAVGILSHHDIPRGSVKSSLEVLLISLYHDTSSSCHSAKSPRKDS